MEHRLFIIMSIGAVLAVTFGMAMIVAAPAYLTRPWLQDKLVLVALLIGYHLWCCRLMHGAAATAAPRTRRAGCAGSMRCQACC